MFISRWIKTLLTLVFLLSIAPCQAIKTLTLEQCIETAISNDPNIKVVKSYRDISKSKVGQARSDYFPSLTGGTGYNLQSNNTTASSGVNTYQLNVGVNQLIWNFGRSSAGINMQKFNLEASEFDLEQAMLDTTYRVKKAYFEVLAALAALDISERTVEMNKLHYERTSAFFAEGLKSKIDVVNAQASYTDSKIQLLNAQNIYQNATIALNKAMYSTNTEIYLIKNTENFNFASNRDLNDTNFRKISYVKKEGERTTLGIGVQKDDILENYTFAPFGTSLEGAIEQAHKNRPDLKSLELVKRAQEEALKAVKRSYMPAISINPTYSLRKTHETDLTSSVFSLNAGLDFPNINAMNIKYKVDEGMGYLEIATQNIELLSKNIFFEVQTNYSDMTQLERKIPMLSDKVKQTLENFELATGRYNVGLGNFIEVQDAQQNYNNAQLALVKCVFDYNVAREALQKSMGVK